MDIITGEEKVDTVSENIVGTRPDVFYPILQLLLWLLPTFDTQVYLVCNVFVTLRILNDEYLSMFVCLAVSSAQIWVYKSIESDMQKVYDIHSKNRCKTSCKDLRMYLLTDINIVLVQFMY